MRTLQKTLQWAYVGFVIFETDVEVCLYKGVLLVAADSERGPAILPLATVMDRSRFKCQKQPETMVNDVGRFLSFHSAPLCPSHCPVERKFGMRLLHSASHLYT